MADLQEIINDAKKKNFKVLEFVTTRTMTVTHPNTAKIMQNNSMVGQATLKRGKKFYLANVRLDNTIAKATFVANE